MTAIIVLLGLILVVCLSGFIVLVMIHAKIEAYQRLNGEDPSAP